MTARTGTRIKALSISLGAITAATIFGAAPAHADTIVYLPDNCGMSDAQFFDSNICPDALFLYYHQGGGGAFADLVGDVPNYSATVINNIDYDYIFYYMAGTSTEGEGQGVRNNAASAYNLSPTNTYTVYYSPGYAGPAQNIAPDSSAPVNLNSTLRNANASQLWY